MAVEDRTGDGGGDAGHDDGHGDDGHGIHMPSPSYYPFVLAIGLPIMGYAAVFQMWWLAAVGALPVLYGAYAWAIEPPTEPDAA